MLRIGLTGGIGSGKTIVAKVFETLGVPVYYADDATKRLMKTDEKLKASVIANFGEESYKNGEPDRKYIASIVFNDREKLELLNSLTHPATIHDAEKWFENQSAPYCIKEAALLFESGANVHLDKVIGVSAPQRVRIERVVQRDGVTADEVMKRLNRQMDEEAKMARCDFIIVNNGEQLVIPQVVELHEKLLEIAKV
jgi:dephospho-CoA kinase